MASGITAERSADFGMGVRTAAFVSFTWATTTNILETFSPHVNFQEVFNTARCLYDIRSIL